MQPLLTKSNSRTLVQATIISCRLLFESPNFLSATHTFGQAINQWVRLHFSLTQTVWWFPISLTVNARFLMGAYKALWSFLQVFCSLLFPLCSQPQDLLAVLWDSALEASCLCNLLFHKYLTWLTLFFLQVFIQHSPSLRSLPGHPVLPCPIFFL